MDKQVKEALDRLSKLREEWLERLSRLTESYTIVTCELLDFVES